MRNSKKKIPAFKTETKEREFWKKQDSTSYVDWTKANKVLFPNLKPTLRTISLRLPESMLAQLKVLANKRDVPYQSLMKIFLAERLEREK
jgi:predicted DNA binding CopG/RHH family protein